MPNLAHDLIYKPESVTQQNLISQNQSWLQVSLSVVRVVSDA